MDSFTIKASEYGWKMLQLISRPFSNINILVYAGVLRFELDRGVSLKPQNPYPSLRVILAEKGTHF